MKRRATATTQPINLDPVAAQLTQDLQLLRTIHDRGHASHDDDELVTACRLSMRYQLGDFGAEARKLCGELLVRWGYNTPALAYAACRELWAKGYRPLAHQQAGPMVGSGSDVDG